MERQKIRNIGKPEKYVLSDKARSRMQKEQRNQRRGRRFRLWSLSKMKLEGKRSFFFLWTLQLQEKSTRNERASPLSGVPQMSID